MLGCITSIFTFIQIFTQKLILYTNLMVVYNSTILLTSLYISLLILFSCTFSSDV